MENPFSSVQIDPYEIDQMMKWHKSKKHVVLTYLASRAGSSYEFPAVIDSNAHPFFVVYQVKGDQDGTWHYKRMMSDQLILTSTAYDNLLLCIQRPQEYAEYSASRGVRPINARTLVAKRPIDKDSGVIIIENATKKSPQARP